MVKYNSIPYESESMLMLGNSTVSTKMIADQNVQENKGSRNRD